MLTAKLISTEDELIQVSELSRANLVSNISQETKEREGFVSWSYPLETLQKLQTLTPSVIVKDGDLVAGYALVLTKEMTAIYPPLSAAMGYFSKIRYRDRYLFDFRTYIMGQVCVHPDYRGKGAFQLLYQFHRQQFSPLFDMVVTEISTSNFRSVKAHLKTGFTIVDTHWEEGGEWHVVVWDW